MTEKIRYEVIGDVLLGDQKIVGVSTSAQKTQGFLALCVCGYKPKCLETAEGELVALWCFHCGREVKENKVKPRKTDECIKGGCLGNPCLLCGGIKPIRQATKEEEVEK